MAGGSSRRFCTRPWNQIAVLSDGTAVCACIDANKTNPLGNFNSETFEQIWNGRAYRCLRESIARDIDETPICRGCPNRVVGPEPPQGFAAGVPKPRVLFIESYAGCNLHCPGCDRNGIEGSRSELGLDFSTYSRIIDALAPGLAYMEFHIGGENYMHDRADEMVRYCKDRNPGVFILTSTNGHFFHTERRRRGVLDSGIDAIIFSIDGATADSYARYRVNGQFERAVDSMRQLTRMKLEAERRHPIIIWRYILFPWNDSTEELDRARRLATEIGVDHLAFHLNAVDSISSSNRYYIGSPHLSEIEDELWDTLPDRLGLDLDLGFETYPTPAEG